jgi:hypothetical protein
MRSSVRDNGVGIPAEIQPSVFDAMQADRTATRKVGWESVDAREKPRRTARRSIVYIAIPVAAAAISSCDCRGLLIALPAKEEVKVTEAQSTKCTGLKGCRILVVDDNVDAATSLRILLKLQRIRQQAYNGGLKKIEIHSCVVISHTHVG